MTHVWYTRPVEKWWRCKTNWHADRFSVYTFTKFEVEYRSPVSGVDTNFSRRNKRLARSIKSGDWDGRECLGLSVDIEGKMGWEE